jgi:hypothetical protein
VKVVSNVMVSNPTLKKLGTDTGFRERNSRHPQTASL